MRISDWSSDVCSSDLAAGVELEVDLGPLFLTYILNDTGNDIENTDVCRRGERDGDVAGADPHAQRLAERQAEVRHPQRSEEHTSELQSLLRISYDVC